MVGQQVFLDDILISNSPKRRLNAICVSWLRRWSRKKTMMLSWKCRSSSAKVASSIGRDRSKTISAPHAAPVLWTGIAPWDRPVAEISSPLRESGAVQRPGPSGCRPAPCGRRRILTSAPWQRAARRSASSSWNTSLSPPRTTSVGQATPSTPSASRARSARCAPGSAAGSAASYFHIQLPSGCCRRLCIRLRRRMFGSRRGLNCSARSMIASTDTGSARR